MATDREAAEAKLDEALRALNEALVHTTASNLDAEVSAYFGGMHDVIRDALKKWKGDLIVFGVGR